MNFRSTAKDLIKELNKLKEDLVLPSGFNKIDYSISHILEGLTGTVPVIEWMTYGCVDLSEGVASRSAGTLAEDPPSGPEGE